MQFGTNVVTEITVPNNVPFEPGNNVIGLGVELPPELITAGVEAAIIFYSAAWDPSLTTPQVKFYFISSEAAAMFFGCGVVANATVSQVANIQFNEVMAVTPDGENIEAWYDPATTLCATLETYIDANGEGAYATWRDSATLLEGVAIDGGTHTVFMRNRATPPPTIAGGGQLYVQAGSLRYKGASGTVTTLAPT